MAGTPRRQSVLRIYTSGRAGNYHSQLAERVGRTVTALDPAAHRAAVSTSRRAAAAASREVRAVYAVPARELTGKFRTTVTRASVLLLASTRRIAAMSFAGKWTGRKSPGATATIVRGQRETYPGAFVTTVKGLESIRVRVRRGDRRVPRGPLQIVRGPSPRDMVYGRQKDQQGNQTGLLQHGIRGRLSEGLITYYATELQRQWALAVRRG